MDYKTLKELVRQGEGKHLEFKLKTNHPEKIVREIVAFANTDGGKLLIGIGDDRSIKGLKYADEDEYILVKAIEKYCSPNIDYSIDRVHVGDEYEVLVFTIKPSKDQTHYVYQDNVTTPSTTLYAIPNKAISPELKPTKRTYIRVADKSIQASKEMREILRRGRQGRDIQFVYGEKEQKLVQYLGENTNITVESFATVANISRRIASKTLIMLVLANVLKVLPDEMTDKFVMAR
jgi:predicted HTH transcriptional regulator